jgi:hypothetical protein
MCLMCELQKRRMENGPESPVLNVNSESLKLESGPAVHVNAQYKKVSRGIKFRNSTFPSYQASTPRS